MVRIVRPDIGINEINNILISLNVESTLMTNQEDETHGKIRMVEFFPFWSSRSIRKTRITGRMSLFFIITNWFLLSIMVAM